MGSFSSEQKNQPVVDSLLTMILLFLEMQVFRFPLKPVEDFQILANVQ
jgi:hypothetical protein